MDRFALVLSLLLRLDSCAPCVCIYFVQELLLPLSLKNRASNFIMAYSFTSLIPNLTSSSSSITPMTCEVDCNPATGIESLRHLYSSVIAREALASASILHSKMQM